MAGPHYATDSGTPLCLSRTTTSPLAVRDSLPEQKAIRREEILIIRSGVFGMRLSMSVIPITAGWRRRFRASAPPQIHMATFTWEAWHTGSWGAISVCSLAINSMILVLTNPFAPLAAVVVRSGMSFWSDWTGIRVQFGWTSFGHETLGQNGKMG